MSFWWATFHGSWTFWAVGFCQCWFHRIRSVPANSYDSTYCSVLGQMAVHGAMAGYSGITVSWTDSSPTCHPKKTEAYKMVDVIILRFHDGVEATVCSLKKVRSCFRVNPCITNTAAITTLKGQRNKTRAFIHARFWQVGQIYSRHLAKLLCFLPKTTVW